MDRIERRRFPRLKAPVFCRPAGLRFHDAGSTVDIGLGGARVFSDDQTAVGSFIELELLLPDGGTIVCKAVVAWIDALPKGSVALFDLGLQFTELAEEDKKRLALVLDPSA